MKFEKIQRFVDGSFVVPHENEADWNLNNFYSEFKRLEILENKEKIISFFEKEGMNFHISRDGAYFYDNVRKVSALTYSDFINRPEPNYEIYKEFSINFRGDRKEVISFVEKFMSSFTFRETKKINWYYDTPNGINTNRVSLKKNEKFIKEFYPFIEDIDSWIDGFFESKSNVLILLGEPGTGKSSLIREILNKTKNNIYVTYDENLIKSEGLYVQFLSDVLNTDGQNGILVLEDADIVLMDRENHGNSAMSKLLNLSDGIIDSVDTKIIFTANLENMNEIDHALTRPGRCYDIVEFRKLTYDEANLAAEKAGVNIDHDMNKFTVGEIYNNQKNRSARRKVGF